MRYEPSDSTVKTLFALSRNQCAFQSITDRRGCEEKLTDPSWGRVLGRICHIRGRKPGAARFDPDFRNVHAFENLILLCPNHHSVIDDLEPDSYPVDVLEAMKERHESSGPTEFCDAERVVEHVAQLLHEARLRWFTEEAVREKLGSVLADAIADMPERQKLVLTLRYYEGLTSEQVGRVLGVRQVESIIADARTSVRERVSAEALAQLNALAQVDIPTRNIVQALGLDEGGEADLGIMRLGREN